MGNLKMPELNSVTLAGRLGRDPEMKYTASGMPIAAISLAFERRVKKGDTWENETSWINCNAFKEMAERLAKLTKGAAVVVEGSLKEEKWEKDGQKRSAIKLIINRFHALEWAEDGAATGGQSRGTGGSYQRGGNGMTQDDYRAAARDAAAMREEAIMEDDLPF